MENRTTAQSAPVLAPSVRLSELLRRAQGKKLPYSVSVELARQVGQRLQEVWARGETPVLVEPDAIWVSSAFDIRLKDVAEASPGKFSLRRRYQSPETKNGGKRTEASDVYGLSALLFELLTGTSVLNAALHAPIATSVPAPSSLVPDLSKDLDAVVLEGVVFDVRLRTPTLEILVSALEQLLPSRSEIANEFDIFWASVCPEYAPAKSTSSKLRVVPTRSDERRETIEVRATALGFEEEPPFVMRPRPTLTVVQAPTQPSPWKSNLLKLLDASLYQPHVERARTFLKNPLARKSALGVGVGFLAGLMVLLFAFSEPTPPSTASAQSLTPRIHLLDSGLSLEEFKPLSEPPEAPTSNVERPKKHRSERRPKSSTSWLND